MTGAEPAQVAAITAGLHDVLGDDLVGVYLHGSLVLGCFNPARSDVDVLAVTDRRMSREDMARLVPILLESSGDWDPGLPRPLEISFLPRAALHPWRHPTPYDLHFGETWRPAFETGLDEVLPGQTEPDPDLAAHITVLHAHGVVLYGAPIADVFPAVPRKDYVDSLARDFAWCRDEGHTAARYAILSMTRVWATLATGEIHSKDSGAAWAAERVPDELRPLVERALESYRGDGLDFPVERAQFDRLASFVDAQVRA
jgi:streptomycin 3"-adenylyltransferase